MSPPTLSVVVPWRRDPALGPLLDSILATQQVAALDLVVVIDDDESSSLNFPSSIHNPRVRTILTGGNVGPGAARNLGLSLCLAPYVVFIDSDDDPNWPVLIQMAQIAQERKLDVLVGQYALWPSTTAQPIPSRYECLGSVARSPVLRALLGQPGVWRYVFSTAYLRRKALAFDSTFYGEDLTFLLRVAASEPRAASVQDVAYRYRRPVERLTLSVTPASSDDVQLVSRSIVKMIVGGNSAEVRVVSALWLVRILVSQARWRIRGKWHSWKLAGEDSPTHLNSSD